MPAADFYFQDGFDKYGPMGTELWLDGGTNWKNTTTEWDLGNAGQFTTIAPALGGLGFSVQFASSAWMQKGLPNNFTRFIGGMAISSSANGYIQFYDSTTAQLTILINAAGKCEVRRGGTGATLIATSLESFAPGDSLEFDIVINGTTGVLKVYKNTVLTSINLTGQDTNATANNYANAFRLGQDSGSTKMDHFYLWSYLAAGGGDTIFGSPVIETSLIVSESAVQSAIGSAVFGYPTLVSNTGGTGGFGNSNLLLIPFTPTVNCTLDSVAWIPAASGSNSCRAVLYNGSGSTKIAEGTIVTGFTTNNVMTLPFSSGQALTAGTPYWFGVYNQTNTSFWQAVGSGSGAYLASSGTWPTSASSISPTGNTLPGIMWGNLSGITDRAKILDQLTMFPPPDSGKSGYLNYVYEDTVGERDVYNVAPLFSNPAVVGLVAVKAYIGKSDGGTRTIDLEVKSSSTFGAGNNAGLSPTTAMGWQSSYFLTDPNTGSAWTGANASAARIGVKVAS